MGQRLDAGEIVHYPPSDYELLHRALAAVCREEWVDTAAMQGDRVWGRVLKPLAETAHRGAAGSPPAPANEVRTAQQVLAALLPHDAVDDVPEDVRCSQCRTPIFCRYYACCQCDLSAGPAVYCFRCVLEGARCDHIKSLRIHRVRRLAPLRAMVAALAAHEKTAGSAVAGAEAAKDSLSTEPHPPETDSDRVSLATACCILIATAREDLFVTCHQCKLSKPLSAAMCCCNITTHRCTKKYCWSCLWNRYTLHPVDCLTQRHWVCPSCRGVCNCKACVRKREGTGTQGHRRAQTPPVDALSPSKRACSGEPESVGSLSTPDDLSRSSGPESPPRDSPVSEHPSRAPSANATADDTGTTECAKAPVQKVAKPTPPITQLFMARVGPFSSEYLARVCSQNTHMHTLDTETTLNCCFQSCTPRELASIAHMPHAAETVPVYFYEDRAMFVHNSPHIVDFFHSPLSYCLTDCS